VKASEGLIVEGPAGVESRDVWQRAEYTSPCDRTCAFFDRLSSGCSRSIRTGGWRLTWSTKTSSRCRRAPQSGLPPVAGSVGQ
jgi:hypothetical protein